MADETTPQERGGAMAPPRTPVVFVSDASVEAERIADTLRAAGYDVVDVPISLLSARGVAQRPRVVLVDVDAENAIEELARLRRAPGAASIDYVYIGSGGGPIKNADDALASDGSAFFPRPVDVGGLVRKVEALTGGPTARPRARPSTPPPSLPVRSLLGQVPPDRASAPSLPAPGARIAMPMSTTALHDLVDQPRSLASFATVSDELRQLLADAELRVQAAPVDVPMPSPEDELEAVLPADVLASLDDPLDEADPEAAPMPMVETSPGNRTTSTGSRPPTTSGGRHATKSGSDPPRTTGAFSTPISTPVSLRPTSWSPPAPEREVSSWAPPPLEKEPARSTVLGPGGASRFFAEAVAKRSTGSLCFEQDGIVRRLVLRDGDMVTAASGGDRESLVHFLGARGELPREEIAKLAEKVPPYGRHAGAALVAHGWLRQDQLWGVLRSHCEWIAVEVIRQTGGTAQLEPEPPGRLRTEPSVFGASTGPATFVDLIRRATSVEEATARLGGESARIGDGPRAQLLAECNLTPHDLELVSRARGGTVGDVVSRAPDGEIAAVIHALALLGVLDIAPSLGERGDRAEKQPKAPDSDAALDEDAMRTRIRARLELVEESDYFALLGVPRDATGYEVRRAFFELRREYEPSLILTPRLRDLESDVRKIVSVLEEAYEILRDTPRRDRYRRAIEARPSP